MFYERGLFCQETSALRATIIYLFSENIPQQTQQQIDKLLCALYLVGCECWFHSQPVFFSLFIIIPTLQYFWHLTRFTFVNVEISFKHNNIQVGTFQQLTESYNLEKRATEKYWKKCE